MSVALLPCPFCGGEALPSSDGYVGCRGCGINGPGEEAEEAVTAWNTRVSVSPDHYNCLACGHDVVGVTLVECLACGEQRQVPSLPEESILADGDDGSATRKGAGAIPPGSVHLSAPLPSATHERRDGEAAKRLRALLTRTTGFLALIASDNMPSINQEGARLTLADIMVELRDLAAPRPGAEMERGE